MKLLSESLLKAIATSLHLEENCFLDQCGERGMMVARFNFYPPCPRPDIVLGVKPHADGSAITLLLQDKDVEGLQVLKDDQWCRVPVVPYGILINVGDQVEVYPSLGQSCQISNIVRHVKFSELLFPCRL